jgi:serine/threonine protein kinase
MVPGAMIVDPSAATAVEAGKPVIATAGEVLGKYRLDRVLGAGGMGIVWAAFDPDLERNVAIKLLHSNDENTLRTRLLREARAMARLKHPNVLTVYEVGTDRNRDYIAMEMVDGGTLDVWLGTKPTRADILAALDAAGRGLAAAHAAGLVHRDFKPHNVMRSNDGHVYVTDFGLARGQIEEGPELVTAAAPIDLLSSPLTQTGVMIGTPAYMAPEQFAGKQPDARTDQFAYCVTAWEALTGVRPFRGDSLPELEKAVARGVADLPSELPPRLRAVLARGLEPAADARWPDMRSLLDALAASVVERPRRQRGRLIAGVVLVVLGAGGAGAYWLLHSPKSVVPAEPDCSGGDKAFDEAWSPERRDAVLKANPGNDVLKPVVMLEDLRKNWLVRYAAACKLPRTAEKREELLCLFRLRDETATATVKYTQEGASIQFRDAIKLRTKLEQCHQQSYEIEIGQPIELDMREPPEPPEPPDIEPPKPPEVPKPPAPAQWESGTSPR